MVEVDTFWDLLSIGVLKHRKNLQVLRIKKNTIRTTNRVWERIGTVQVLYKKLFRNLTPKLISRYYQHSNSANTIDLND
jgi:hypothetical protein